MLIQIIHRKWWCVKIPIINNNTYLKFKVSDFDITRKDKINITTGTKNYVILEFEFSDNWGNLESIAIISKKGIETVHISIVNNECQLPNEFMETSGYIYISVISGDLKTVDAVVVNVRESGFSYTNEPAVPPTPKHKYVQSPTENLVSQIRYTDEFEFLFDDEWKKIKSSTSSGDKGNDGKSAYELAIEEGFVGTLNDWLNSLKGEKGIDGINGLSAFDIAIENGFHGTEQEWLESLKGEQGENFDQNDVLRITALEDTIGILNEILEERLAGVGFRNLNKILEERLVGIV